VRFVDGNELALVRRDLVEREERVRGANRETSAAVDAAGGIDVHLRGVVVSGLIAARVDAIDGAGLNAELVLDAVVGDYVGHG
jgi:hypothetical protein